MLSESQQFPLYPDRHDNDDDLHDISFSNRGCCFWLPSLTSKRAGSVWWQRISTSDSERRPLVTDTCWTRGWKALREWSELLAGPRWKTFIRTFRKNRSFLGGGGGGRHSKFQYDPSSYALNFDDGQLVDEDLVARGFSSRYAAVPASVDVGKDSRHSHVSAT